MLYRLVSGRIKRPGPPLRRSARATASPPTACHKAAGSVFGPPCPAVRCFSCFCRRAMPKSTSLWIETATVRKRRRTDRDASADVCVVGAGIAGLTTAYLLARDGASVVVIDAGQRRQRPDRHDDGAPVVRHRRHGSRKCCGCTARMARAWRARVTPARSTPSRRICTDEHIDCRFERVDGYLFLGRKDKESTLDEELEAARAAGAEVNRLPAGAGRRVQERTLPPVSRAGAVPSAEVSERPGDGDSAARRADLFRDARRVEAVGGDRACVQTAAGHAVRAGSIVDCDELAVQRPGRDPHEAGAVSHVRDRRARRARRRSRRRCTGTPRIPITTCGCTGRPTRELGGDNDDAVDILIVGGEDHKAGQAQDAEARFGRLDAWMRERFPSAGRGRVPLVRPGDGNGGRPRLHRPQSRSTPTTSTSSPAIPGWG